MNPRLARYLACGALVVLVALPARAQVNLVLNGDFETGLYSPEWTLAPGGPFDNVCLAGTTIGAATCIVHGGQYAMSFGLNGAQDSLSQTIPTVAGNTYVLSFWLANDNPLDQNTTTFAVFWDGNNVYSLASPQPTFPYTQVVLNVTASTNSTPLTFVARHDPSQWFLDDVSLVAQADLAISKTDGVSSINPGATTSYTIVVSNAGPSGANGAVFTDPAVANLGVTSVTCGSPSGGAACPTAPNTTVVLMQGAGIVIPTLPAGGSVTFTVTATVAGAATGSITNTASIAAPSGVTDPNLSNNSASDTDTVTLVADLAISKTDGVSSINPGATTSYTIVVSNAGPSGANGAVFTDPAVANLGVTSVTCGSPSGGAACPTAPNTTVVLMQGAGIVIPTLPAGGSVTFTVTATVAGAATGSITNTASIAAPSGVTDPNLSNNSASDTDTVTLVANLTLAKTDGNASYTPSGAATYSITVTNSGPSNANNTTVTDNLPSGVTLATNVTCVATGTAACGSISSVGGGTTFTATGAMIAAGAGNQLVYSVPVQFAPSLTAPQITNTATASDPAAPTVASGSDTNVLKVSAARAQPIPADDRRALLLLIGLILFFRWRQARLTALHRGARRV